MIVYVFESLSILAIVAGGLVSAFTARRPTRQMSWLSAYLVLVVGVIQLGLINVWHRLGQPRGTVVLLAFLAYNLGNVGVALGSALKAKIKFYSVLVNLGGLLLAIAMILLLLAVRHSHVSWTLVSLVVLVIIVLVSMPIGLILSRKRHAQIIRNDK